MTNTEIIEGLNAVRTTHNGNYAPQIDGAIQILSAEPCDCISRQQAIDKMQELEDEDDEMYGCSIPEGFDGKRAIEALKTLPSIQPKTGHWIHEIEDWNKWTCSECGWSKRTDVHVKLGYSYCPNCGAKMESEEKE